MPIKEANVTIHEYPVSRLGVNLHKNLVELAPQECVDSQNMVWDNGMVKRGGQALAVADEVVASKRVYGLHRFYKADGSKQILAACDTKVRYWNGSAWADVKTSLTTAKQTHMTTWGPLDKVYISNGTDAPHSWDGSASASVSAAPATTVQFLPYQDRLLSIAGGDLTWSASYSTATWETVANCGVRPDTKLYGMTYHSVTNVSASAQTMVLLAGSNGMYVFVGTDLRPPYTTGDYSVYTLATTVGCNAPRTMCWTPKGTMWLGIDKQVYMLPFNSLSPVPVGTKIQSKIFDMEGIEKVPSGDVANACAVYHNGFYKLSCSREGQTTNNVQWWLDVNRLYQDEDGHFGPWYGPMLGQTISCFATQNGAGDGGELLGGEATAKGYVYTLHAKDVFGDYDPATAAAKDIYIRWKTYYNPIGDRVLRKDVHKCELELLQVLGTTYVEFWDMTGALKTGDSFDMNTDVYYWNDLYWNEFDWANSKPIRQVVDISPAVQPRRLSILIKHNSKADAFELYSVNIAAVEQSQIFG